MNLREALVQQSPSLALQRAAADEIAKLEEDNNWLSAELNDFRNKTYDLESYLEAHDLTKDFEVWLKRNKEE